MASGLAGYAFRIALDAAGDTFILDSGVDTTNTTDRVVKLPADGGPPVTVADLSASPYMLGSLSIAIDAAKDLFVGGYFGVVEIPVGCVKTSCQFPLSGVGDVVHGLSVDAAGDLFIASDDESSGYSNGEISKVPAGGGTPVVLETLSSEPLALAVNKAGDLFVNVYVGQDSPAAITWFPSAATMASGKPIQPGVNFGGADLCSGVPASEIADFCYPPYTFPGQVLTYKVTASGTLGTPIVLTGGAPNLDFTYVSSSSGNCAGAVTAGSYCYVSVQFNPLVAGPRSGTVQIVDGSGHVLITTQVYGYGNGSQAAFNPGTQASLSGYLAGTTPLGPAVLGAGDVFLADPGNNKVLRIPAGCATASCQSTVGVGLSTPNGAAEDGLGNVFIADTFNDRILKVAPGCTTAACQTTVRVGLNKPHGVAIDPVGDVFIADTYNNRVLEVPPGCATVACQTVIFDDNLDHPHDVALQGFNLFIADTDHDRILELPVSRSSESCATTALKLDSYPLGLALDAAGDLYVYVPGRIFEVPVGCSTSSCETTFGVDLSGTFAMNGAGDIFVADDDYGRIVEVQRSQPPAFAFPVTAVNSVSSAICSDSKRRRRLFISEYHGAHCDQGLCSGSRLRDYPRLQH